MIDGRVHFLWKQASLPEVAHTQDFFGLNYYSTELIKFVLDPSRAYLQRSFPPGAEISPTGFLGNVPLGMFESLALGAPVRVCPS